MVNGLHDWVIPRQCVKELREKLGNPPILWLNSSHYTALVRRAPTLDKAADFLALHLMESIPGEPPPTEEYDHGLVPKFAVLKPASDGVIPAVLFEVTDFTHSETLEFEWGLCCRGLLAGMKLTMIRVLGGGFADADYGVLIRPDEHAVPYVGVGLHF